MLPIISFLFHLLKHSTQQTKHIILLGIRRFDNKSNFKKLQH